MSLTVAERVKLAQQTTERLEEQIKRLNAEIQSIIREISLDISESGD